jgi:hypothetical protein
VGTQQVQLNATLTAGPAAASDSNFPTGNTQIDIVLNPPAKVFARKTGDVSFNLNSAGAPFALPEIGTIITQCTTFLFVCKAPMTLVLTFANPGNADIVSTLPVDGAFVYEGDPVRYLKAVTVQGAGDIEYFASGNQ